MQGDLRGFAGTEMTHHNAADDRLQAQTNLRFKAAERALQLVKPGMVVGLGSGPTAALWIRLLGQQVLDGNLAIQAIASSPESEALGRLYGIPFTTIKDCYRLDLTFDDADEIGPRLALIQGGNGSLLRGKIIASATKKYIVVGDRSNAVSRLGSVPLPVEVVPLAEPLVSEALRELGFTPNLRRNKKYTPFITDEGNCVLDCIGLEIGNPYMVAAEIDAIVGVVEHGLFLDMTDLALISSGDQIIERTI
jgi:ribose 5-phosphate isomerase A